MIAVLGALGAVLWLILRVLLILLAVLLLLAALLLLCPFCAELSWAEEVLRVRAGVFGLTFPVFQYPAPEHQPEEEPKVWKSKLGARFHAWRARRRAQRAGRKPEKKQTEEHTHPRKKAKLTLQVLCTMLEGAGRITRAVFGALRFTHIRIYLPVGGGEDPAASARSYGQVSAWLYTALGFLNRFLYLEFDELRLVPLVDPEAPEEKARVSFRVSAQLLFIVIAGIQVLLTFLKENVLDVFL